MYTPGAPVGSYFYVFAVSLTLGFFGGWSANTSEEYNLVCCLIALALIYVIKKARDMHANDIIARSEIARAHRKEEKENMKTQMDLIAAQAKSNPTHDFTSENFDIDARRILNEIIQKARKQKHNTVTGAILVTEFLKSIR
jgi:hypothetical protein